MDTLFYTIPSPEFATEVQEIFWEKIYPIRDKGIVRDANDPRSISNVEEYDSDSPLTPLQQKYPFLSNHLFVFEIKPGFKVPIHIDASPAKRELRNGKRLYSINVPIQGCGDNCITEFYEVENEEDIIYIKERNVYVVRPESPKRIISTCAVTDLPMLINTQVPHGINNQNNLETRISVSWTIKDSWQWEDVIDFFKRKPAEAGS